ncbi:MAG: hypothetical protein R3F43_29995 [bacterium]
MRGQPGFGDDPTLETETDVRDMGSARIVVGEFRDLVQRELQAGKVQEVMETFTYVEALSRSLVPGPTLRSMCAARPPRARTGPQRAAPHRRERSRPHRAQQLGDDTMAARRRALLMHAALGAADDAAFINEIQYLAVSRERPRPLDVLPACVEAPLYLSGLARLVTPDPPRLRMAAAPSSRGTAWPPWGWRRGRRSSPA